MKLKLILFFIPLLAWAHEDVSTPNLSSFAKNFTSNVLNPIITILFVLATIVFMWGVIQYALMAESEEKIAKARNQMLWGIIGLAIMASAWGIVRIFCVTFFAQCP